MAEAVVGIVIGFALFAGCMASFFELEQRRRRRVDPKTVGDTVWIDGKPFVILKMNYSAIGGETTVELLDQQSFKKWYQL